MPSCPISQWAHPHAFLFPLKSPPGPKVSQTQLEPGEVPRRPGSKATVFGEGVSWDLGFPPDTSETEVTGGCSERAGYRRCN
jgi:hypothetical protein